MEELLDSIYTVNIMSLFWLLRSIKKVSRSVRHPTLGLRGDDCNYIVHENIFITTGESEDPMGASEVC